MAPKIIWKWGAQVWRKKLGEPKKFLVVPLHFFGSKAQLVVLASAFVMVSTVWSVSCLLFFYSRCPRAQPFVKVGGTCPTSPMESAPLLVPRTSTSIQTPRQLHCCWACHLEVGTLSSSSTIHPCYLDHSAVNWKHFRSVRPINTAERDRDCSSRNTTLPLMRFKMRFSVVLQIVLSTEDCGFIAVYVLIAVNAVTSRSSRL